MCRITLIADPALRRPERNVVLNALMSLSVLDDRQDDGHGITDGKLIYKSALPYSHARLPYSSVVELDENLPWLAHVRKASAATGKTQKEAHPYQLTLDNGDSLVAVHNGSFSGYHRFKNKLGGNDHPDTDTYYALTALRDMMNESGYVLDRNIVGSWLSEFYNSTEAAVVIYYRDRIYLLRAGSTHSKTLHFYKTPGGGIILNTSEQVLRHAKPTLDFIYEHDFDQVYYFGDSTFVTMTFNGDYHIEPLEYKFSSYHHATTYVSGNARNANVSGANSSSTGEPAPPRNETYSCSNMEESKKRVWEEIRDLLSPLNLRGAVYYGMLTMPRVAGKLDVGFLVNSTVEDLQGLRDYIKEYPITTEDKRLIDVFNSEMRRHRIDDPIAFALSWFSEDKPYWRFEYDDAESFRVDLVNCVRSTHRIQQVLREDNHNGFDW